MTQYLDLFTTLNRDGIQYIIVGGLATVLHGYARLTADIDLVINLDSTQAKNAITTITALGLKPQIPVDPNQFADKTIRNSWIKDKNMIVFSFYHPDNPLLILDLFVEEPMPYSEMASRSVLIDIGGINVPVCAISDLITMKKKSARVKDLDDIKYLLKLQDQNNES